MDERSERLPGGTLTLLFTELKGATQLAHGLGERYGAFLTEYRHHLRTIVERHHGAEVDTQGDAFFVVFTRVIDALNAAVDLQRSLTAFTTSRAVDTRPGIALHTGAPTRSDNGYVGLDVHRAARLCAAAHGGQVLLSQTTYSLASQDPLPRVGLVALGSHHLKDIDKPEHVYQLEIDGLHSAFPPLLTTNTRATGQQVGLPPKPTPIIGRERETGTVCSLLRREDTRLLTLTGPGGTGKTRLALQVANELVSDFVDGVFFVELDTITDPALVLPTIARTLGLKESGHQGLDESIRAELRTKQILLVLDNFEQVTAAAGTVAELLAATYRAKFLVTSRVVLHIYGEHEFPVPPLALPDPRKLPPLDQLMRYPAVALFTQRAQAVKPDFAVTADNAKAIADICARLDGLPLAIELAAARVKLFAPQALLGRLDNRLKLLTGGSKDLTARQQTLRGAIDWSHNLLDVDEQVLFARLSVFAGGCHSETAEVVCGVDGQFQPDVLDGLQSLLNKSLLVRDEQPAAEATADITGEPRFIMLETIREYALERLSERGESAQLRDRHLACFARLADGAITARQFDRLDREHENLRAALQWSIEGGSTTVGGQLAATLWPWWERRGFFSEARGWLQQVLDADEVIPPDVRAKVLLRLGEVTCVQGDHAGAVPRLEESIRILQSIGDTKGVADAMSSLGIALRDLSDYERARVVVEVALELHRALGDRHGVARSMNMIGCIIRNQGDLAGAEQWLNESMEHYRALDYRPGFARIFHDLGETAHLRQELARAAMLYREAEMLFRELDMKVMLGWSLHNQAYVLRDRQRLPAALGLFRDSLQLFRDLGTKDGTAACLSGIASGAVALGHLPAAAQLVSAAEQISTRIGGISGPVARRESEHILKAVRDHLHRPDVDDAWQKGRAMPVEQVVADALNVGT